MLSIKEETQEKGLSMRCLLAINLLLLLVLHLCEAMYHDNRICLYYKRKPFYQLIVENERFPRYKSVLVIDVVLRNS